MEHQFYTVRDNKTSIYFRPFYEVNHIQAQRALTVALEQPESLISQFPEDYDLWYIGTWDDQKGQFKNLDRPEFVCSCQSLILIRAKRLREAAEKEDENAKSKGV